jgi:hypothetical protein
MLLFREKVLILLKDKHFSKFLIIDERRQTGANGCELPRKLANGYSFNDYAVRFLRLRMTKIVKEKFQMTNVMFVT